MRRTAIIVAATVEVLCPHCGESQPNPDNGAFAWTPDEVTMKQGRRECVSCDFAFTLHAQSRVSVMPTATFPADQLRADLERAVSGADELNAALSGQFPARKP